MCVRPQAGSLLTVEDGLFLTEQVVSLSVKGDLSRREVCFRVRCLTERWGLSLRRVVSLRPWGLDLVSSASEEDQVSMAEGWGKQAYEWRVWKSRCQRPQAGSPRRIPISKTSPRYSVP